MNLSEYLNIPFEKTEEMRRLEEVIAAKKERVEVVRTAHQARLWELDKRHGAYIAILEMWWRGQIHDEAHTKIYTSLKKEIDGQYKQTRMDMGGQQLSAILEASPRKEIVELRRLEYAARKVRQSADTMNGVPTNDREGNDQPQITIILPGQDGYEAAQRGIMKEERFASEKARLDAELFGFINHGLALKG